MKTKRIIKTEVVDDVTTTIQSPRGMSTTWLERQFFEDGSSEIVVREEVTFGYNYHKRHVMLVDTGKRH